jgi:hypothetical protein
MEIRCDITRSFMVVDLLTDRKLRMSGEAI